MRDRIGNAIVSLGMRVRSTKRYSGGVIPTPSKSDGVLIQMSPGAILNAEDFARTVRGVRRVAGR